MDDPLRFGIGIAPEFHIGKSRLLVTPDGNPRGSRRVSSPKLCLGNTLDATFFYILPTRIPQFSCQRINQFPHFPSTAGWEPGNHWLNRGFSLLFVGVCAMIWERRRLHGAIYQAAGLCLG